MAPSIQVQKPQDLPCPTLTTLTKPRRKNPSENVIPHQAERKALLASLRGQTIRIPDLTPLSKHWPTWTNPNINLMNDDIRDWLNATLPQGKVLSALQRSEFGLFGSTWWPHSTFDKLKIVTYLAVWLFTWDDEIDLSDGTMWDAFGAAQIYRTQTLAYVRWSLGIDSVQPLNITNRIILNFAPIGAACRAHYSLAQNKMVYEEMRFFMDMSEREQRLRLSGAIPNVDEFWHYRLGSSAVTVCLALNEFSWEDVCLPASFYDDDAVKALIRCTNTIISATNDLLSVKKEIKRDAIDSLIPILWYHNGGELQSAVATVADFIKGEIAKMDDAADKLFATYAREDEDLQRQVGNFVHGCKTYVTGNLTWSLETDRYGVERVNGEIVMTL
ncbi:isoprenoid synthase domain-containing protein [Phaeosphaeriaceae sp. PMI808]|nr:isoprenoid synthase domain-containing protein [Phaeosphaeriaceae sp. PMI808]